MPLMNLKLLLVFLLGFISLLSYSQSTIKGTITDTSTSVKTKMAVVSLIKSKDSVLHQFARADEQGNFELKNIPQGNYILMVSFPGFADYVEDLEIKASEELNRNIFIIPKSKLLQEIIIQNKVAAIRIKGDTTEYKADSFKVGPNANVQDLLKRLPGLQVNSKGEITAQGQKVEKVLVDGEEFFSDDPAVVTQTLRADVVDKVQVFDKKSEQAEFTGVDDGQKTKTINLELKDDKKKGYFGKLEAGTDFNQYQSSKGMINSFQKKRKAAAFITNNNTTFEGLNWSEQRNFGSSTSNNMEMNDDGGMMIWNEGDEFSSGQGLPNSTTAGASYSNKWNKDKHGINGSYQFNNQNVTGRNESITKTILPDTTFTNTTAETFNTFRRRNKLSGIYDWQIDSSSSLKFKANGSLINGRKTNTFIGRSLSEENAVINSTNRTINTETESRDFTSELTWKKKLKKQGRTISITGNFSNNERTGDGFLLADNLFFGKSGNLVTQQNLNQQKTNDEIRRNIQSSVVFTESLSKKWFLELNYRNSFNRNNAEQNTLEQTVTGGDYNKLIDSLSNKFLFRTTDHTGGFSLRFTEKKYNLSFGSALGRTNFNLEELRKNRERKVSFTNLLPRASFKYQFSKQQSFDISYNGNTQNPTLQQINPIIDNIDPLNITIGNENLRQSFSHNFRFNYYNSKILKSKYLNLYGNFSLINNAISNANFIDTLGRRVNQSINVSGNYNGMLGGWYSFEFKEGYRLSFNTYNTISRFKNVINSRENTNDNYAAGVGIGFSRWSDKLLSVSLNFDASRNFSKSSINSDAVTRFWRYTSYQYLEMKFKKPKMYLSINGELTIFQRTAAFQNQRNIFIVNSTLRKTFTKKDAFELRLSVNDLFNQNLGIQRNVTSNFVQEQTFQNLRRFFLLSFVWNFNKNGKPSEF